MLATATLAQAQVDAPRRLDVQGNAFTMSAQDAAALAIAPGGAGVLVWQSRRQQEGTYGIYARRFLADGRLEGEEIRVNLTTSGHQNDPAVALDDAGGAWFAWTSFGQDDGGRRVVARRTDALLGGGRGEVLLDGGSSEPFAGSRDEVAIAAAADGRAVAVWTAPGSTPSARVILARKLEADGAPLGEPFAVSQRDELRDATPRLAADAEGGFVVVWSRAGAGGRPAAILARAFDAAGAPRGDEVELQDPQAQGPIEPTVALERAGGRVLVVGWLEREGDGHRPMLRRLEWDGASFEGPAAFHVPTGTDGYTSGLEVALEGDRALVVWGSHGPDGADLHARRLHWEDGAPVVGERAPATGRLEGPQRLRVGAGGARLALGPGGWAALAWSGDSGHGDASAANVTLLDPSGTVERPPAAAPAEPEPVEPRPHDPPVHQPASISPAALQQLALGGGPDFGFVGIVDTGWNPPDPHLAVGAHHLVAITNGRIAFFERNGTRLFEQAIEGPSGFWGPVGATSFVFDPEVLYDPYSARFLACAVERAGGKPWFLLAVSDGLDPTGAWHRYRFDVQSQAGDNDIDSPVMAVDGQAVYLCADFFGPDKFLVFMLEKAPLLAGLQPATRHLVITGSHSFGVPVSYPGASAQYMVEASKDAAGDRLRLHAIGDPLGTPTHTTFDLPVPLYTEPEDPPQLGASSRPETFDARVWSSVYRGGSLWATHHVGTDRVRQRWYEIRMNGWPAGGTPALEQWGEVDLGPDVRTFFGSLWVDYFGNMGMVFSRSSPSEFISPYRAFRNASDPPGVLRPPEPLQTSTAPELSGRWGDYSAVGCDPAVPGIFWGIGQYRSSSLWATWIGAFGSCLPPTPYCTAKTTSLQTLPRVSWTGLPSISKHNFHLTLEGGVPLQPAAFFESHDPYGLPFQGGTLCVLPPLVRSPLLYLDALGGASEEIRFQPDELGSTRYYQFWFRDQAHPDLTAAGLSNALRITVCP